MKSLILQNVTKDSKGKYVCQAHNEVGTGSSDEFNLDIKCKNM